MNKLIIILGPTASGKTSLAVTIADQYNGEIISADSRQIYKGMDIGTGKDLHEYNINGKNIKYHLIDILDPYTDYSVFHFKKDFDIAYNKIIKKNKFPILCGGTALYIDSILYDYQITPSKPDLKLRSSLEKLSKEKLIEKLSNINNNAYHNAYHISKRRLIRSIEILKNNSKIEMNLQGNSTFKNSLVIGIKVKREKLLKKIKLRLEERLDSGLINEVKALLKQGIDPDRLYTLGLEYRFISEYLNNNLGYEMMKDKLNIAINQFSKRQMTFFRRIEKRGVSIHWIANNNYSRINDLISDYLS